MVQRFLIALFCCLSLAAHADYPDRPIRIIVPFPAGDGLDIQARMIGQKLTERMGQQVIIDNKPGASGQLGELRACAGIVGKVRADMELNAR